MGSINTASVYGILPRFFEDKPIFGMDIGHSSVRVMEVVREHKKLRVLGYGTASFDESAFKDGVLEKPEVVAEAVQKLFKTGLVGKISTNRVAITLPVSRAFTRFIDTPKLSPKELAGMVRTEVEQYIPAAIESLYVDYEQVTDTKGNNTVFVVAMPRRIVDSYVILTRLLGLELVLAQTTSSAGANLFKYDAHYDIPTVLVDFGSDSADVTIIDHDPLVSGTAACGGEQITAVMQKTLGVTRHEAVVIKSRYGLTVSKKQKQIEHALKPTLDLLTKEIRRTIRYYDERSKGKRQIGQIIIMGGGANMPGLAGYLTNDLRLPVRSFDPNTYLSYGRLQPLGITDRMSYATVAGIAMQQPEEVFAP